MIVCFSVDLDVNESKKVLNIYAIGDHMTKKGWILNALQYPASLHLCCTRCHVGKEDIFLEDLFQSVVECRGEMEDPNYDHRQHGNAAIYGMASTLPSGPLNEMLITYNDVILGK